MDLGQCFDILELPCDVAIVSFSDAKDAHRLIVQIWHPDRYGHNEKLFAKATAKMKEINAAWELVGEYFKGSNAGGVFARHSAPQSNQYAATCRNYSEIVRCPSCGTDNFVRDVRGYNPCEACCYGLSPRWHDTVTDYTTKLIWPYDANIPCRAICREDASVWLERLKYRNDVGWRLPTREEFALIVLDVKNPPAYSQKSPYKNVQEGAYWVADDIDADWSACMVNGDLGSYDPSGSYHVWPVRSCER